MRKFRILFLLFFSLVVTILSSSCAGGYSIVYGLGDKDIVNPEVKHSLNVQLLSLSDNREAIEKEKSIRMKENFKDIDDYTYDLEFRGEVNEAISDMIVNHLHYSKVFESIKLGTYKTDQITDSILDELAEEGVDAVIRGQIENFYGYYDINMGTQLFYMLGLGLGIGIPVAIATTTTTKSTFGVTEVETNPLAIGLATGAGTALGGYLESMSDRNIKRHLKFSVNMLSTQTKDIIWQETFEINLDEFKAMPGINTEKRKFEIVIDSLRDAVNQMAKSLSEASIPKN